MFFKSWKFIEMKTYYLKIEGRVQRVGYRRWAIMKAMEIGEISGFVRNMEDGSVEILMRGEEEKLDEMLKQCYSGPFFARVDKISFLLEPDEGMLSSIKLGKFIKA